MGEGRMIESARDPHCPKVSFFFFLVNIDFIIILFLKTSSNTFMYFFEFLIFFL